MKLTKYRHACLVLETDNQSLIIDPGSLSTDFVVPENVVVVVITHEHPDHFDTSKLDEIFTKYPDATLIAPKSVLDKYQPVHKQEAVVGSTIRAANFMMEFFGGKHALVHEKVPIVDNVGVFVNETLYYPGDSFALPNKPVELLAVPLSGPFSKLGESIDFILSVAPKQAFSTHDTHLSKDGESLVDRTIIMLTADSSISYKRLNEPLEI